MESNTLDDLGRSVLEAIDDRRVGLETLASETEAPRGELDARLEQLLDNALVREVDGGEYERTENGRRVLEATPVGSHDDRIDVPENAERTLEDDSLRADEERAVRSAFAYLRHWGEVTTAELVDGVYSEAPAGYDTAEAWWGCCVRDRLEAVPDVRFDPEETPSGRWRYAGEAVVDTPEDDDGRAVADPASAPPSVGSVRHAIETSALDDSGRTVARTAFEVLCEDGPASAAELVERAVGNLRSETASTVVDAGDLADRLSEIFAASPEVERAPGAGDGPGWRYAGPDGASDTR